MDELSENVLNALSTLIDDIKSGKIKVTQFGVEIEVRNDDPKDGWEVVVPTGDEVVRITYRKQEK